MVEMRNIEYVVYHNLCMGCGVCEVACPSHSIRMTYNSAKGLPIPSVDRDSCLLCQKCLQVCFGYGVIQQESSGGLVSENAGLLGNHINVYSGSMTDKSIVNSSSSGGVVTALVQFAFEKGIIDSAVLTRLEVEKLPYARAFLARTSKEVSLAAGSKYCPVSFAEGLKRLGPDDRFGVVALPCQAYAIRKLAEINPIYKKGLVFIIGLLCGGTPTYLGTRYLLHLYGFNHELLSRIEYRGGGWPGRLLLERRNQENRRRVTRPYPQYWQGITEYFFPFRCTICTQGFNEFSDVSCGDMWSSQQLVGEGNSLMITRTALGESLVRDAIKAHRIHATPLAKDIMGSLQPGLAKKPGKVIIRKRISRIFQKKFPIVEQKQAFPLPGIESYLLATELYVGRALASRGSLWIFLKMFLVLKRMISFFRRFLK